MMFAAFVPACSNLHIIYIRKNIYRKGFLHEKVSKHGTRGSYGNIHASACNQNQFKALMKMWGKGKILSLLLYEIIGRSYA